MLEPETIQNMVSLRPPTGMSRVNLPDDKNFLAPFGRFQVRYRNVGGVLDKAETPFTWLAVGPSPYSKLHRMAAAVPTEKARCFKKRRVPCEISAGLSVWPIDVGPGMRLACGLEDKTCA